MSKIAKDQKEEEIKIFGKFLKKYPFSIQKESIIQNDPPFPDIICRLSDGAELSFELVEILDGDLAKSFSYSISPNSTNGVSEAFWIEDPCIKLIKEKLTKKYYGNSPIELLAYYNTQSNILNQWKILFDREFSSIESTIKENFDGGAKIFRRIWIYSFTDDKILFHYPKCNMEEKHFYAKTISKS